MYSILAWRALKRDNALLLTTILLITIFDNHCIEVIYLDQSIQCQYGKHQKERVLVVDYSALKFLRGLLVFLLELRVSTQSIRLWGLVGCLGSIWGYQKNTWNQIQSGIKKLEIKFIKFIEIKQNLGFFNKIFLK